MVLTLPDGSFADWPDGPGPLSDADVAKFRQRILLTDGGVYDNHGLEPLVKRFTTVFASDGGAPFSRTSELSTDWISQLRRVIDVIDNQVAALRRHDLIDRFIEGNRLADEAKLVADQANGRMGAYWGIDTNPAKLNPPGALACNSATAHKLALVGTRLSDLGDQTSKQLINWGYTICDRSIRSNYKGTVVQSNPAWPYQDAPIG
jgi:NTE family protein